MRSFGNVGAARRFALVAWATLSLTTAASANAVLSTHVPKAVAQHIAPVTGALDPASHLQLEVALPMRNMVALEALKNAIYNPQSPQYRHYLTVAQFTEAFGPTKKDYDAAVSFFRKSGLAVTGLSANRYLISLDGKVADIQRVFHVKMNLYQHPRAARNFFAPDREPTLDLKVAVLHVDGLDNYLLPYPKMIAPKGDGRSQRATGSGPGGNFIGSDMRAAYYGGSTLIGGGQSVGLMELEGYNPSSIPLYFSTVNQPLNVPVNGISVDGTAVDCGGCNDAEQALDIEYAISMAPGLAQVQVYVAQKPLAILNQMATDNVSKSLSTSWGWNENFKAEDPIYQEMAVQGQTFLTASGDDSNLLDSGPWPEEDANLVAVGGTDLVTQSPAGPYQSETGWEDSAGGPSLDPSIKIEPYQKPFIKKKTLGSKKLRNVPDVAANADFDMYICYKGKCSGGWAGTSFSSPMWAGFVALVNEQAADNGKPPVGFLNPTVYGLAKKKKTYKAIFHDVVGGVSGLYTAVKGYDLVTGLGSPNGQAMIDALAGTP
jgi:subtilase family serine protease